MNGDCISNKQIFSLTSRHKIGIQAQRAPKCLYFPSHQPPNATSTLCSVREKNETRCVTVTFYCHVVCFTYCCFLKSFTCKCSFNLREVNTVANILITLECSGFRIRFRVLLFIPPQKLWGVPTSQFPSSPKMNFLGTASFSRRLFFLIFKGSISKELSSKCFEHSR